MRIAVFGTGGVGGVYGAKLAHVGNDVVFIARGAHLRAMRERGLRLTGHGEEIRLPAVQASERPDDFGPVDLVLFCVKLYDTETAAQAMRPLIGPETLVITLQNGVDGRDRIGAFVDSTRVLAGATYIGAAIVEPGHIRRTNPSDRVVFGERDGSRSERTRAIAGVLAEAGIEVEVSDDIDKTLWTKFVLLASNAGLTALARVHIRDLYTDPDLRSLARDAMEEIVAVARAKGVNPDDDIVETMIGVSEKFPPEMTTSMHNDLRQGRRLELRHLSGLVARLGAEMGVATPVHGAIAAALSPYVDGTD